MKKAHIYLTTDEWRIVIDSLNDHRNKLIAEGKHTDFADSVLLKAMTAPTKKVKIA
jgi:beta-galactosidase beta subunit